MSGVTRTVDVVDELTGVAFRDPYRWLEEQSEEVRAWQSEQAARASSYVREPLYWEPARRLVEQYRSEWLFGLPRFAGGVWFRDEPSAESGFPQVVVSDEPFGEGRVLLDLGAYKVGDDLPFLSWLSPSPDGRVLAFGVCTDGSEQNTIRLIEVASGSEVPGVPTHVLHDSWAGGAVWLPDSSAFYFVALVSAVHDFEQAVFLHRLGGLTTREDSPVLPAQTVRGYTLIQTSARSHWAVAAHRWMNPIPVAVRDLDDPAGSWRPFVTETAFTVAGQIVGDRYVAITDVDAPRGRLVAIPLDADDPNDTDSWIELIPASNAVLRAVTPVGDHLYVSEFDDTYTKIRIVDADGRQVGTVPLPGRGATFDPPVPFNGLPVRGHPDELVFAFSTLASSAGIYRHRPGAAAVEILKPPDIAIDAVIEDHWATSPDGTRIPYQTMRHAGTDASRPLPTLLYAYGGFNVPMQPHYPPQSMAAFAVAGGVFVLAHIRGGGEFGRDWWYGARMKTKQNCYDDLYAVAEDLVARGITTSDQLALTGGSGGGLMSGVAVTQRPDLWKAVVPRVPILDLIGSCRDPYDRWVVLMEWADVDDPAEVRRLATFSPYQLVEDGTVYPAVYLDAGDTDPRCPPWHARKFGARLQAAQAGDAPILVHVWEQAGHGWATDKSIALEEDAEVLAFLFRTLEIAVE
jgi:prolyl oligopeptidase